MFTKIKTALARRWLAAEQKRQDQTRIALEAELRDAKARADANGDELRHALSHKNTLICANNALREELTRLQENLNLAVDRLEKIAELLPNKATANGTAKKMARIAREAVTMIMGDK